MTMLNDSCRCKHSVIVQTVNYVDLEVVALRARDE